ncbi:uncharacterized protein LOC113155362 isoform X1 [Anabas testudineus]|uniref:uncharacterized protein LOC113155362 isoform X1 n=1 Tax=Anabas testudineus TaxID=64144 RepID=UPI000E45D4B1|nr:uncharacterized protein LOC113155362 isoform X1 [Anabas testudineus]
MKSFLLLVLSLTAGCETSSGSTCDETWAECDYEENKNYQIVEVDHRERVERSTKTNMWENKGTFFLFHNTRKKELKLVFLQRQVKKGEFKCRFYRTNGSTPEEPEETEIEKCETQTSIQTTYRSAETTIPCGNHQSTVQFFCRQNGSNCENILPSGPSPQTNRFTLTNSGSISIRDVSSQDDGVYWCGLRSNLTKIQLQVQISPSTSTTTSTSVQSTTAAAEKRKITASVTPTTAEPSVKIPSVNSTSFTDTPVPAAGSLMTAVTAVLVCVVLLVLLLVVVWIHKRSRNNRNRGAQVIREDYGYAEIQQPPQQPDSGPALKTTYVTANFPTNPSAFLHNSTVDINGDTYSTVWNNQPPESTENPLYYTVTSTQRD